jgi:hypothetical protein
MEIVIAPNVVHEFVASPPKGRGEHGSKGDTTQLLGDTHQYQQYLPAGLVIT